MSYGPFFRFTLARLVLGQNGIISLNEADDLDGLCAQGSVEEAIFAYARRVRELHNATPGHAGRLPQVDAVDLRVCQLANAYQLAITTSDVFGMVTGSRRDLDFAVYLGPSSGQMSPAVEAAFLVLGGYAEARAHPGRKEAARLLWRLPNAKGYSVLRLFQEPPRWWRPDPNSGSRRLITPWDQPLSAQARR